MNSRATARADKRRATFRQTTKPTDPRNRLLLLLVLFVVVGAGFIAVLVDLQTVRSDGYRSWGEDQRTRTRELTGYRGSVLDRNGFVLAAPAPGHKVVADPTMVENATATAELLAPILGLDISALATDLTPSSEDDRYSLLARNLDDEATATIEQLELAPDTSDELVGVWLRPEEDRVYPAGDLATAIVGRVDPDEQGIRGVEQQYNDLMAGVPGTERFEGGRFGSISVGDRVIDPATSGYDVTLTIDHRIQYVTEQALVAHCETTRANGATAVMADPHTGQLLAMASVERQEGEGCTVTNYNGALVSSFEPGSVVKPLVVAATMEELGYTADLLVDVPNRLSLGGKTFVDHPEHPAAPFPISEIIAKSMNVGTIRLAQRLAPETLYDYFTAFGFGRNSGLGLDGESSGRLRHPDEWWGSDHGSIPIGQGLTTTAIQLLGAYNTIANGGTHVAPVLVQSLQAPGGDTLTIGTSARETVISPETAAEVTKTLVAVVNRGTGAEAALDGYQVAGKTGTAWKVFDDGSGTLGYGEAGNRRYVVTFAGFVPADDPALTMVVVVDEPRSDYTAGAVAAPLFAELADYAVRILAVPPALVGGTEGERVRADPAGASLTPAERDRLARETSDAGSGAGTTEAPVDEAAGPGLDEGRDE
jgi:cell division protein FtsI (penicillin-binding protein 3)